MNGPLNPGEDVALFIDWENFKISLATGQRQPNVSSLKEEVANHGRVVVAKAYADWVTRTPELRGASQFINDPPALYAAGIEPVYVPTRLNYGGAGTSSFRTTRVKNSVDVKMTADCIECAHSYPNIGTFVLVSGDSDFIHVMNVLRTMGKRVIIIGVSWATSRRLADQADVLILYDVDIDPVTVSEVVEPAVPVAAEPARSNTQATGSSRVDLDGVIDAIEDIVRTERQSGGTPLLTSIKQRLMRRHPGFDEKSVGFSGFKKLMSRVAQNGKIKLITAGLVDWAIMSDEKEPTETSSLPSNGVGEPPVPVTEPGTGRGRSSQSKRTGDDAEPPVPGKVDGAPASDGHFVVPPQVDQEAVTPPTSSAELDALLAETLPQLDLPEGPGDGQDGGRVADLIVMADTLEHRDDVDHVAFNFLVGEVCQALEEALKADHEEITQRWGEAFSRLYVTKMVRSLGNADLFVRGWDSTPDQVSGRSRRHRTFLLNRENPLVQKALQTRWESTGYTEHAGEVSTAVDHEDLDFELPSDSDQPVTQGVPVEVSAEDSAKSDPSFFSRLFRSRG